MDFFFTLMLVNRTLLPYYVFYRLAIQLLYYICSSRKNVQYYRYIQVLNRVAKSLEDILR